MQTRRDNGAGSVRERGGSYQVRAKINGVSRSFSAKTKGEALRKMRDADIRRLPVVQDGRPVGIVSLGDLAVEREPDSTLADISAASPDN